MHAFSVRVLGSSHFGCGRCKAQRANTTEQYTDAREDRKVSGVQALIPGGLPEGFMLDLRPIREGLTF